MYTYAHKIEYPGPAISGPSNNEPIDAPGCFPDMVFLKVFVSSTITFAEQNLQRSTVLSH